MDILNKPFRQLMQMLTAIAVTVHDAGRRAANGFNETIDSALVPQPVFAIAAPTSPSGPAPTRFGVRRWGTPDTGSHLHHIGAAHMQNHWGPRRSARIMPDGDHITNFAGTPDTGSHLRC